ncbi:MAG: hypothetical protein ACLFVP_06700 [Candidatus Bathyarchaeia archaeon]
MKLILGESNPEHVPKGRYKRWHIPLRILEDIKSDVDQGNFTEWGICPGGGHGFALTDLEEDELFRVLEKYRPAHKFTVEPMLSIEDCLSSVREIRADIG